MLVEAAALPLPPALLLATVARRFRGRGVCLVCLVLFPAILAAGEPQAALPAHRLASGAGGAWAAAALAALVAGIPLALGMLWLDGSPDPGPAA